MYVSLYIILVFIHTVCLLFHKHYFNGNWRKVIVFIITIIIGVSSWRDPFYSYVFLNNNVMWCGRCIFDFLNGLDSVLGDQNFILYSKTACILVISGLGHKTVEIYKNRPAICRSLAAKQLGLSVESKVLGSKIQKPLSNPHPSFLNENDSKLLSPDSNYCWTHMIAFRLLPQKL